MSTKTTIITPSTPVSTQEVAAGDKIAIKHNNGTYFGGWSGIGPRFGVSVHDAQLFDSNVEAVEMTVRHFAFADASIVAVSVAGDGTRSVTE